MMTSKANCYRFWEAVQQLKALPQRDVQDKVDEIWTEFLAPDASCPINVDSQSYEITKKNVETPDRWSFDVAAVSNNYGYFCDRMPFWKFFLRRM
jgi:hypothetical protein